MHTVLAHLRTLVVGLVLGLSAAVVAFALLRPRPATMHLPDPPSLVERVREVARLEALDVAVYKKVAFEPDPQPSASMVGDLVSWAAWSVNPPAGKAIVFADAHVGLDLSRIDAGAIRADGDRIEMVLPPLATSVEIRPGETEIVRSNLDSTGTTKMLDKALVEIRSDVDRDANLHARARASAERALRSLFLNAGFREVSFVDSTAPAITAPAPGV
jgi:hypothetical protein